MKKTKKIIGGLTALAVISAMCAPMSVSAETATTDITMTKVSPYDELYTVTIPETVTVTNSGWNELKAGDVSGIKVEQTVTDPDKQFDPTKKVTISVASENSYKLKDGDNTVSYTLNAEANGEAVDKWEFSAEEVNAGTAKTVGVDVDADEYDAAPDGSYTDTLTFGISVEDAVTAPTLAGVTLTDGMIIEPHCNVGGEDNWAQFKYVAADDKFVPNFNSYDDVYSKSKGSVMQQCADQWAMSVLEMNEEPNGNFYLTQTGNTVHLRADDGIDMQVIDLQLDFDNMTYTQLYKMWYNTVSGSFTSIKIGDTTITASQMTAN